MDATLEETGMALPAHRLSLADFLTWENEQFERHEFFRGGECGGGIELMPRTEDGTVRCGSRPV